MYPLAGTLSDNPSVPYLADPSTPVSNQQTSRASTKFLVLAIRIAPRLLKHFLGPVLIPLRLAQDG